MHGTSKSTVNVYVLLLFPFVDIYTYMFTYAVCVFRAMSHELFAEQVKGTTSTYKQSEGNWMGVQRYAYQYFSKSCS